MSNKQQSTKTDVAKMEQGGMPAFLKDVKTERTGMEGVTSRSLVIPRLSLLQSGSKALDDYPEAKLRKGQFFHSIRKEGYDAPLRVVPVHMRERCIIFQSMAQGNGIITQSSDGITWDEPNREFNYQPADAQGKPLGKAFTFRTGKSVAGSLVTKFDTRYGRKPLATTQLEAIVVLPDHGWTPAVFCFQRTGLKIGQEWYSYFASEQVPLFALYWQLDSRVKGEGQTSYLQPSVVKDGFIESRELADRLAKQVDHFAKLAAERRLEVDTSGPRDDDERADSSDASDNAVKKHGI